MASTMQEALVKHDGSQYDLIAWCIMPNHVHVLIKPMTDLSKTAMPETRHSCGSRNDEVRRDDRLLDRPEQWRWSSAKLLTGKWSVKSNG